PRKRSARKSSRSLASGWRSASRSSRKSSDRRGRARVYFVALATDYDGTLAHGGVVSAEALAALGRLKETGRRLILVTGRELDDVDRVCRDVHVFDRVVAENGAVLLDPATGAQRVLGEPPPEIFVERLRARRVEPLSVGRV